MKKSYIIFSEKLDGSPVANATILPKDSSFDLIDSIAVPTSIFDIEICRRKCCATYILDIQSYEIGKQLWSIDELFIEIDYYINNDDVMLLVLKRCLQYAYCLAKVYVNMRVYIVVEINWYTKVTSLINSLY